MSDTSVLHRSSTEDDVGVVSTVCEDKCDALQLVLAPDGCECNKHQNINQSEFICFVPVVDFQKEPP